MQSKFYNPMTCPCGRRIWSHDLRQGVCPGCESYVRVSRSYRDWTSLLVFVVIVIVAALTYSPTSSGRWILLLFVLALPMRIAFNLLIPPTLEKGVLHPRITIVSSILSCAYTVFVVDFLVVGWAYVAFSGPRRELNEHLEMISAPLGMLSAGFVIRPDKSFLDVLGIILGNSLFWGTLMFLCYKTVRSAFNRNRVTQMAITDKPVDDTEDE